MAPSIKLFLFMKRRADVAADVFSKQWLEHAAASCGWPDGPARLTVCEGFADAAGGPPVYEGVTVGWFDGVESARRFADAWIAGSGPYADAEATDVVIADELILRGEDYLDERWTLHAVEERVK